MSRYSFKVGATYRRRDIKLVVGIDPNAKGGPWDTGYAEAEGAGFIFCNVGTAGRTGQDHGNYFDGKDLVWRGKTNSHKSQPMIRRLTSPNAEVHLFWRSDERDPFTYAGLAAAVDVTDERPVRVSWRFNEEAPIGSQVSGNLERLPAETLKQVTPEHVWQAVQQLEDGSAKHSFADSTEYDLIASSGKAFAPQAVFGIAARLALGFEVLPKHFIAGVDSPCFRILKKSGYPIVRRGSLPPSAPSSLSEDDKEWSEGNQKLVTHLVKERGRGLSAAKKAQFKREHHGKLYCERCSLDPVQHYGTADAEACIEVHHHDVRVGEMQAGHRTKLESLQCLCANCQRLVHKTLRASVLQDE